MRGKLRDTVFTRNRQGTALRARVTPLNPPTIEQQNQRAILAAVASEWRNITEAQRQTWNALAAQLSGNLTGFNVYVRVNATLVTLGIPALQTAPAQPAFGIITFTAPFTAPHAAAAPHALTLNAPLTNTVAPDAYLYEAAPPVGAGRTNVNANFRVIYKQIGALAPTPAQLATAYIERFGDPADGLAVSLRITQITKGFRGVPFTFRAIVTLAAP